MCFTTLKNSRSTKYKCNKKITAKLKTKINNPFKDKQFLIHFFPIALSTVDVNFLFWNSNADLFLTI